MSRPEPFGAGELVILVYAMDKYFPKRIGGVRGVRQECRDKIIYEMLRRMHRISKIKRTRRQCLRKYSDLKRREPKYYKSIRRLIRTYMRSRRMKCEHPPRYLRSMLVQTPRSEALSPPLPITLLDIEFSPNPYEIFHKKTQTDITMEDMENSMEMEEFQNPDSVPIFEALSSDDTQPRIEVLPTMMVDKGVGSDESFKGVDISVEANIVDNLDNSTSGDLSSTSTIETADKSTQSCLEDHVKQKISKIRATLGMLMEQVDFLYRKYVI